MLARFLGFQGEQNRTDSVWAAPPAVTSVGRRSSASETSGAGGSSVGGAPAPKRARRAPVLSRDKTLPEFEFDRRVAFWAMTRSEPPTATFRFNLFEQHLRNTFETDQNTTQALRRIAAANPNLANKTNGLRGFLADMAAVLVRDMRRVRGLRTILNVADFENELRNRLAQIRSVTIRNMAASVGVERIINVTLRALRDVSQEQALAAQLKSTAQTIRKLEDLLARGRLMDEDIYELKLRRDLFLNSLRLYARLTREANAK